MIGFLEFIARFLPPPLRQRVEDVSGNLLLTEYLYLFLRDREELDGSPWDKYIGILTSVCRNGTELTSASLVKRCLRYSPYKPNTIHLLTPESASRTIDGQYRDLILPALYLRYTLAPLRFLDSQYLDKEIVARNAEFKEGVAPLREELKTLEKILQAPFSDYLAAVLLKGGRIAEDTTSSEFADAVKGFQLIFERIPGNKMDFAVGYYSTLALTYGGLVEKLLATLDDDGHLRDE